MLLALVSSSVRFSTRAAQLDWKTADTFRYAELSVPSKGQAGFTLIHPDQSGITFSNRLSNVTVAKNRLTESGSGVALGDIDGDGRVDIYFCRMDGDNALYRNLGDWKFKEVAEDSGTACPNQFSTGCVLADIDGNGDLDLLVNGLGRGTRAFINDGRGHFSEKTDNRLISVFGATSMALADVEGDGDLDLYVTNYRTDTFHDNPPGLKITTRRRSDGAMSVEPANRFVPLTTRAGGLEIVERGEVDAFYINVGGGRFSPIRWNIGVFLDENGERLQTPPTDWGLSVTFRDLNGDGLPDLYVCNDFVYWPDRIWLNKEGKRFQAAPLHTFRNVSLSSMAVDVADINRDGLDDIFVSEMLSPKRRHRAWQRPDMLEHTVAWPIADPDFRPEVARNTLHLARDDGSFAEIAQLAGVSATDWSWSCVFLDVDLDGWEDLLVATGNLHDVQDTDVIGPIVRSGGWKTPETRLQSLKKVPHRRTPSVAFRNMRNLTFEDASSAWGFDKVGIAHGMALADLDNDGDLDVVMNSLNAAARVFRNNSPAPRIAVRLKGANANTRGIGARIKVTGGPVTQTQEMISGGRYCSSDDPMRVFAADDAGPLEIEVKWRSGKTTTVKDARPNRVYEISESSAEAPYDSIAAKSDPLFEDVSARLNHSHIDSPFDDFSRQPLLPRKLSTLGPGVSWADVDNDGLDDLIIAGGRDGRPAIYRNDAQNGLTSWNGASIPTSNQRDQTSVLVWHDKHGSPQLLLGESNWEDADTNAPAFRQLPLGTRGIPYHQERLADGRSATGPLALADVDNDGDLDLFVGGHAIAGNYPEPATSHLLGLEGGGWIVTQSFSKIGLVNGAVFTDIDADGDPDLALACEWDSIRVFRNELGRFTEVTESLGLAQFKGRWNGIAAGDFDGDGRLDLVASNWGRNWRTDQPPGAPTPVHLYYGDFSDDGVLETLLASTDPILGIITPWRERKVVAAAISGLEERLPNHHAYGAASVGEVLEDRLLNALELTATTFDSMIFLNRGGNFESRPLPIEAQFAPAFGVSVADYDGDGSEDLFLAQNFFGVDSETSRHDAGVGLLLLGDGQGGFRALGPRESGIAIQGEQRGSAIADFDGDGRTDLVVSQQNGPTKLFRNRRGAPGVRVTLLGTKGNPTGIGATVRLRFSDRLGPAREIHGGSGYWSQDSTRILLAAPTQPMRINVQWPGGQNKDYVWPSRARSMEVSREGVQAD